MKAKISTSKKFSKNFDQCKNQRKIDFIIFHHVEAQNANQAIELFEKHEVSSHYLIDEKGKIFQLVDDNDIAYHAGRSFWRGFEGLNKNSIGIEFINRDVFNKKFTKSQLKSGLELCLELMKKHEILPQNVAGHSDIAFFNEDFRDERGILIGGFLDRKQDPSHLFDWSFFAQNGVGIYPILPKNFRDKILFRLTNRDEKIISIKKSLAKFGYKIDKFDGRFDLEFQLLVRVFNRHFNGKTFKKNPDFWWKSSDEILKKLMENS